MKLLLTNDDGIYAEGLWALHDQLSKRHRVSIVAPDRERSAVGHGITLHHPLRAETVSVIGRGTGTAVSGTPADCVKLAYWVLLKDQPKPDVLISGINLGANSGINVIYSGTVSAATEGAFLGIPSAAISLDTRTHPDFHFAARFTREIIRFIRQNGLRQRTALNVNIPALPPEKICGVSITRQGVARFMEKFERRIDPRGNVYYWLSGETPLEEGNPDADARALKEKRITITPISYDLTCEEELARLRTLPLPALES